MSKKYLFTVESFEIENTRSRHADTVFVSCSLVVGANAPQSIVKGMGDLNNGIYPIGLSIGPVDVGDKDAAVFNYLVVNNGHGNQKEVEEAMRTTGGVLAQKGAEAASKAIAAGVETLVGATVGSYVMPVIGTVIGAIAGWLVGQLGNALFANCDGPVAAEQIAITGAQLAVLTANGRAFGQTTFHPGTDSPSGCGSNSKYKVTWKIVSTEN